MAIGQTLRLELEDGRTIEATYDGRDIRMWEARHKQSAIGVPLSLSMLTWFGWSAAHRTGQINGEFPKYEAFDAVCVAVTSVKPEPEPDDDDGPGNVGDEPDPTEAQPDTPPEVWAG